MSATALNAKNVVAGLPVSETAKAAVDDLARFIVRFGLTVPAILSLESLQPLSFVGSQFMHVLTPSIGVFLTPQKWEALAELLEQREGLNYLIDRIETLDRERAA